MGERLTIGAIARAAEVPTSTIRYYERAGLLQPNSRSASNYRLYSGDDLERLLFIRAAKTTGFSLEDIAALLRPAPCRRVQELIEDRLSYVEARMKELRHVKRVLGAALETCHEHEATGRCRVVADLTAAARSKRP